MLTIIHHLILIVGEGPTDDINGSIGTVKKKFCINFSNANVKVYFSLGYKHDNSYLFVNRKEIYKSKADN